MDNPKNRAREYNAGEHVFDKSGSIFGWETGYRDWGFREFPQLLQTVLECQYLDYATASSFPSTFFLFCRLLVIFNIDPVLAVILTTSQNDRQKSKINKLCLSLRSVHKMTRCVEVPK